MFPTGLKWFQPFYAASFSLKKLGLTACFCATTTWLITAQKGPANFNFPEKVYSKSLEHFQKVSMFGWNKTKIEKTRTKCYFDTLADLNSYSISSINQNIA